MKFGTNSILQLSNTISLFVDFLNYFLVTLNDIKNVCKNLTRMTYLNDKFL